MGVWIEEGYVAEGWSLQKRSGDLGSFDWKGALSSKKEAWVYVGKAQVSM